MRSSLNFFRNAFYQEEMWTAIVMLNSVQRNTWYWRSNTLCWTVPSGWKVVKGKPGRWAPGQAELVAGCVRSPGYAHLSGVCFPEWAGNKTMKKTKLLWSFHMRG